MLQEGNTVIKEIKAFHRRVCEAQNVTTEVFKTQCRQLYFSVDGVAESKSGKRSLIVVSDF